MDTPHFFDILFSLKGLSNRQLRSLSLHVQKKLEKDELKQAMEVRAQQLDGCKIIRWGDSLVIYNAIDAKSVGKRSTS